MHFLSYQYAKIFDNGIGKTTAIIRNVNNINWFSYNTNCITNGTIQ